MSNTPWKPASFTAKLRAIGGSSYHSRHPFHVRMNEGKLNRDEIKTWIANRFYYQVNIPIKDAAIMSNCPIREVRRLWLHRITDHDGFGSNEGGIEAWLRLGMAAGLDREKMIAQALVVPGVRFAVDAYVNFTRREPWPIAVASSLTELFAPDLMATRLAAFRQYYKWVKPEGLDYFANRLGQAPRDSREGLELTLKYCVSREMQEAAVNALQFKCDLLWAMLDSIDLSCRRSNP